MIIWLASYPRSGNTFLRILLNSFFGQQTYSKYNDELDIGKDASFSEVVGHVAYEGDWTSFYEGSKLSELPVFIKTHDKPEDEAKAIYIVREGRAAAVSYWKYLRNHSKLEIDLSDVIAGSVSFGTWSSHVTAWDPENRPNTHVIKYENLVSNPIDEIERLGNFLGMKPVEGQIPNFDTLKDKYPGFFRVGNNEDNLSEISRDEKEWMIKQFGPSLKALGYIDNIEFDEEIANQMSDNYQQKSLKVKREIAALTDDTITSRLEGRLQNLKVDIDNEFETLRTTLNKDSDSAELHQKLFQDIQDLIDEKLAQVEKPIHEKLNAVFSLSSAVQNTFMDAKTEREAALQRSEKNSKKVQDSLVKTMKSTVSEAVQSELGSINDDLSRLNSRLEAVEKNHADITHKSDEALTLSQSVLSHIETVTQTVEALKETRVDRNDLVKLTGNYISELEQKNQFLVNHIIGTQNEMDRKTRLVKKLRSGIRRLSSEHDDLLAKNSEYEFVLQPRFRSLLELRPIKHILKSRKIVKALGGSAETLYGSPSEKILMNEGISNLNDEFQNSSPSGDINQLIPEYSTIGTREERDLDINAVSAKSFAANQPTHLRKAPLGIAVYTFDRKDMVHNVLESLAQQGVLDSVHVFIDGDQGNPNKRRIIDQTEAIARQYPVKKIHRNRGNFGFRKMMLTSQRYMLERYEKIIFLEDDCFPAHNAVTEFSRELDLVSNDPSIFSVYGHPFLVPGEDKPFGRFQGWGWATTSEKLEPFWRRLMDLYLLTEAEYLKFIDENLTKDLLAKIDITPGRQPSSTLKNFFAWDETLCMLTAMHGAKHKRSDNRLIFNCGVGDSSAHFSKIDYYRKPPFNMVSPEHIWDYF